MTTPAWIPTLFQALDAFDANTDVRPYYGGVIIVRSSLSTH